MKLILVQTLIHVMSSLIIMQYLIMRLSYEKVLNNQNKYLEEVSSHNELHTFCPFVFTNKQNFGYSYLNYQKYKKN
jgi:hypothetical protein